jgi:hypothetical protein
MRALAFFAFAAFAFSRLVGVIELWWTRQAQQRRQEKTETIFHPLPRDQFRRVRSSRAARVKHHGLDAVEGMATTPAIKGISEPCHGPFYFVKDR